MTNNYLYFLLVLLLFVVLYLLRLVLINWFKKRKQIKRLNAGKNAEDKAYRILVKHGFKKIAYQKPYEYVLKEDGIKKVIKIIPDFVAHQRNRFCVIEVKWGASAPSIKNESTRRQLLEYYFAIKPDTLYLLDMSQKKLKEIEF